MAENGLDLAVLHAEESLRRLLDQRPTTSSSAGHLPSTTRKEIPSPPTSAPAGAGAAGAAPATAPPPPPPPPPPPAAAAAAPAAATAAAAAASAVKSHPSANTDTRDMCLLSSSSDLSMQSRAWNQGLEHGERLYRQMRDVSLVQEPPVTKQNALYVADKERAVEEQLRDKKTLERLTSRTRVISDRLKKTEKDSSVLQELDVLVRQVVENHKADRQLLGSLRSELHAVKAQLSGIRASSCSSIAGGGGGGKEAALAARETVDARLAEELPRLSQDIQRGVGKVLREWAQTMTQALHQRNGDLEKARGLGDDLAKLSSRVQTITADAVKRDKRLHETFSEDMSTAIASLVEKFNASTAVSQRELRERLGSLEKAVTQVHGDNQVLQQQLVNVLSQIARKDHIIEALHHRVEVLEAARGGSSPTPVEVDTNPFNQFSRHLYLPDDEEEDGRGGAVDAYPGYEMEESKLHVKKRLIRERMT